MRLLFLSLRILLLCSIILARDRRYRVHVCVGLDLKQRVFGANHNVLMLRRRHDLNVCEELFGNALQFSFIERHDLLDFIKLLIYLVQTCLGDLRKS